MIQKDGVNAGDKLSLPPREYTLGFHLVPPTKEIGLEPSGLFFASFPLFSADRNAWGELAGQITEEG